MFRSAELQILPREFSFVGAGLPHVGPWDYPSRVPMFWYGPGFIRPLGIVDDSASSADISPTWARLLGADFPAPHGRPLNGVLVPDAGRRDPPRLIVTVVWDGAGRNVLDEWPEQWPNLRSLLPQGAWIEPPASPPWPRARERPVLERPLLVELEAVPGGERDSETPVARSGSEGWHKMSDYVEPALTGWYRPPKQGVGTGPMKGDSYAPAVGGQS